LPLPFDAAAAPQRRELLPYPARRNARPQLRGTMTAETKSRQASFSTLSPTVEMMQVKGAALWKAIAYRMLKHGSRHGSDRDCVIASGHIKFASGASPPQGDCKE